MKFGTISMWGEDLEQFRQEVRRADELDFDVVGIGDSPAGWHEMQTSMTIAALETQNAKIAPMVTSPFVRHPLTAANGLCSVDELSGGRVILGLATGGSTIMAIGHPPATQKQMRDYWDTTVDLFEGRSSTFEGRPVDSMRHARKLPIYYSAFGPKALALAGEKADGVVVFTNAALDGFDEKLDIVRASAKQHGRNPDDVDVWAVSFCSIRPTREQAIEDIKAFIVVNGMAIRTPETLAKVPGQFRDKIQELHRRYDPTSHVVVGGKNVQLMDELGLTDFLCEFDTLVGDKEMFKSTMKKLEDRGVSTFFAALPGHADPLGTIERVAEAAKEL